jgi:hypothetical protein
MTEWAAVSPLTFKPYTGSGDYLLWQATDPPGDGGQSSSVGRIAGSGKHTITVSGSPPTRTALSRLLMAPRSTPDPPAC